jgi:monovalent cation:H+ antiporter-2, CPA2 family
MDPAVVSKLLLPLLAILLAGLVAGIVCKRLGISVLVGYLAIGALLGHGTLLGRQSPELSLLAQAGALLLLFAIGIEFSIEQLRQLSRYFFVGGLLQMLLVIAPVAVVHRLLGGAWGPSLLVGAAVALSSTVLVYKSLEEFGQTETAHGRRAIAMLLFQDVAVVPLVLLVPLLVGRGPLPGVQVWLGLAGKTLLFVAVILAARVAIARLLVPLLATLRSTELVVLFALLVLGGACLGAYAMGLPPVLGAFAAGLALSGNRLTAQVDALVLPYRETFSAVFFVSLGTLMRWETPFRHPWLCLGGLLGVLLLKSAAAALALRFTGLRWRMAGGMGLGLAQMGEFSFLLLSVASRAKVVEEQLFEVVLFLALGTLLLTPLLIRVGLRRAEAHSEHDSRPPLQPPLPAIRRAGLIGLGPTGMQVASRLEISGVDVCLIDLSPVNLHAYAQEGFHTVSGDASDAGVLRRAAAPHWRLAVVTVPHDATALQIVKTLRRLNRQCTILVRCRYQSHIAGIRRAGANAVVSEELEASAGLLRLLEGLERVE